MTVIGAYDLEWLEVEKALGSRPCFSGSISQIRSQFVTTGQKLGPLFLPPDSTVHAHDESIESGVTVRVYIPQTDIGGDMIHQKLPIGVYFHGGGFIMGDLETGDADCRHFAFNTSCVIVSVRYRLAPEVGFEDMLDDCISGYEWAWKNAIALGGDQNLVFLIGESAGACLALQVTNNLIARGYKSTVQGIVALCPMTSHPTSVPQKYKKSYRSYEENATDVPLIDRTVLNTFMAAAKLDSGNPSHFVTLSKHLAEFPPTFIITAEKDPLRDDGVLLEMILHEKGARVKRQHYSGFGHAFWIFPMLEKRKVFLSDATEGIKFILSTRERL